MPTVDRVDHRRRSWAWPTTLALLTALSTACDDHPESTDTDHGTIATLSRVPAPSPTPGQVLLECARVRPRDGVLRWLRYEYGAEQATMRFGLRGVDTSAPVRGTVDVLLNGEQQVQLTVSQSAQAGSQASVEAGGDRVALPSNAVEHTAEELSITLDPATTASLRDPYLIQMWGDITTESKSAFCESPAIENVSLEPSVGPTG